jgi:MFS family permease
MPGAQARGRPWLTPVAVALVLAVALPPAGSYARQYAFVQAIQFVVFAVVAPALLTLGRRLRSPGPGEQMLRRGRGARQAEHPAAAGRARALAAVRLLTFIALVTAWRLPVTLDILARDPAWTAAEIVTLTGAGSAIWMELAGQRLPGLPLPRPLRAGMAAMAMWTIWVIAYVTGMSGTALTPRSGAVVMSAAADRQLAVAVMWAVPAACFAPAVYSLLIGWLSDRDQPGEEPYPVALRRPPVSDYTGPPRPPRGWRPPPDTDAVIRGPEVDASPVAPS